jgi:hypothetical protein
MQARVRAAKLLAEHEPPGLPPGLDAELRNRFDLR